MREQVKPCSGVDACCYGRHGIAMEPKEMRSCPYKERVMHNFGRDIVGDRVPTLEEGRQYKFLGVLETLVQEEKMVL